MATGSRYQALRPRSASSQKPDASAGHYPRKFRIKSMARQPDEKAAAKFTTSDSALIRELALLLDETSLTEIEIERAGLRVRVARNVSIAASVPMAAPVAAVPPPLAVPVDVADM